MAVLRHRIRVEHFIPNRILNVEYKFFNEFDHERVDADLTMTTTTSLVWICKFEKTMLQNKHQDSGHGRGHEGHGCFDMGEDRWGLSKVANHV